MTYWTAGLISAGAAALNMMYAQACAAEVPIRKPGQWQITTVSATVGMTTVQTCIAATDDVITGENAKNCSTADVKKIADETFVNVTCKLGNGTQKISTLLTGDFSTWYRAVTKITFDPPQDGVSHFGATVDGKYLGPTCSTDNAQVAKPQK